MTHIVDSMMLLKITFEPEERKTFESQGYVCWDVEKTDAYKRHISEGRVYNSATGITSG